MERIKSIAQHALKLQNKLEMERALTEIVEISSAGCSGGCQDMIEAGDVLVDAEGREFKVDAIKGEWPANGFGLAHLKKEGCAIHPDDVDATMTDEQCRRQLAAYERDTAPAAQKKARVKVAK